MPCVVGAHSVLPRADASIGPYKCRCDRKMSYTRQTAAGEPCSPLQSWAAKSQGECLPPSAAKFLSKSGTIFNVYGKKVKKEREHMYNHIDPQPICCKKEG